MNRQLSDWASIAEIISGLAVVATLIFLALGIRENTEVTRAAAYERNIDSVNQWRLALASDPGMVRSWGVYNDVFDAEATDAEIERLRFNLILNVLWGVYEKSYYATQYGTMAPSEWRRFERQLCPNRANALESDLWERMAPLYTDEFANYVESLCAGP